ncbi:MAG: hypothetical protein ACKVOT_00205 [Polaromonas sp.]
MIKSSSLKSIPLVVAMAAALVMGNAVHAQGAGAPGAGTSAVQNGAAPAPGTPGAGPAAEKPPMAEPMKPLKAKKVKHKAHKAARPMNQTTQQPMVRTGPTEDPSRIKP